MAQALIAAAAVPAAHSAAPEIIAVVQLGAEHYGITAAQVHEIVRSQEITEVPNAPARVEGVINLRGRIVPVVDLRSHFGLSSADHTAKTRIVITQIHRGNGDSSTIGLVVDAVDEIGTIAPDQVADKSLAASSLHNQFLRGVVKLENRLVMLLDIDKAF